jgi:hypothetical protein
VPRFFFDTYNGDRLILDELVQDLDSIRAAKAAAQVALLDMARDNFPDGGLRSFVVSVRNEAEQLKLQIALSMVVDYVSKAQE